MTTVSEINYFKLSSVTFQCESSAFIVCDPSSLDILHKKMVTWSVFDEFG